jgi:putative spermidine/putrescine transport system permease protein
MESAEFTSALRTSLLLAICATSISMVIGSMAAFSLDRYPWRRRNQIMGILLSPLIVPMLVTGIAMLQFFAMIGLPRSFFLLLLGHLLICLPYVIRMVLSALSGWDSSIEEAAMNLGASRMHAILLITLPNIAPGLIAAAIFAFIESFGNLTLSTFISGSRVSTLPVRLFTFIEFSYDSTVTAVSTVILVITLAAMLLLSRAASLERLF